MSKWKLIYSLYIWLATSFIFCLLCVKQYVKQAHYLVTDEVSENWSFYIFFVGSQQELFELNFYLNYDWHKCIFCLISKSVTNRINSSINPKNKNNFIIFAREVESFILKYNKYMDLSCLQIINVWKNFKSYQQSLSLINQWLNILILGSVKRFLFQNKSCILS